MLATLADVLEVKTTVGIDLKAAYDSGDTAEMARIADEVLPEILRRLDVFYEVFCDHWERENRIIGFEVLDIRFGGLRRRIESAIRRVKRYLAGEITSLPELEEERLFYDGRNEEGRNLHTSVDKWHPVISACPIDRI